MEHGWTVVGEVVHGRRLGRELGFPTANIEVPDDCAAPDGVYRSRVAVDGTTYDAMSNLGCNPSVGGSRRHLETHLFGFGGSLYGRKLQVDLLIRIRDERTFPSVEALRQQLEEDKAAIEAMIADENRACRNILQIQCREEFREWLRTHSAHASECWVDVKRGRPTDDLHFWYIDAVEEALCVGWIDSTHRLINGKRLQRFTPRKKNSNWTELNKARVRRLEKLGLMTDAGRAVLPAMDERSVKIDSDVEAALKTARAWSKFKSFPTLYQKVKSGNIAFYKRRNPAMYARMLARLIEETKRGSMFGEWNDYGRLIDY